MTPEVFESLATHDRIIAASLLGITFFGPLIAVVILAFGSKFRRTKSGQLIMAITAVAGINCSLAVRDGLSLGILEHPPVIVWAIRAISVCFILGLLFSAREIGQMSRDGTSIFVRVFSFIALLISIPMGFAPLALWIEGVSGFASTLQYYGEFVFRMADVFSFGAISNYDIAAYQHLVVLTKHNSLSAVVFNFVMGAFMFSALLQIVRPNFSKPKPLDTQ